MVRRLAVPISTLMPGYLLKPLTPVLNKLPTLSYSIQEEFHLPIVKKAKIIHINR